MKFLNIAFFATAIVMAFTITSCDDDDVKPDLIAGFSYEVDGSDYRTIHFENTSTGFESLSWDFGDNTGTSTDTDPTYTYAADGEYKVTLTASNGSDTDEISVDITVSNDEENLQILTGGSSKSWKLLRAVSEGSWPLEVGPIDRSQVWWGLGRNNDDIILRDCSMNDEFIFSADGTYEYNSNGDFWAEGGVFEPANLCQPSTAEFLTGPGGSDLSAFGDGTHSFTLNGSRLTVSGLGAFVGLQKIGTDAEVSEPQQSVSYDLIRLSEGSTDTLVIESKYKFPDNTSGEDDAYWRVTLVHYDDEGDEPPVCGFTADVAQKTVTLTNLSYDATTYLWDFGDGMTSGAESPTHEYTSSGTYTIQLTASRGSASDTYSREVTISGDMTRADLVGGAWTVRNAANSIFVGPGLGDLSWWQVPPDFLDGSASGGDDWSCIVNDEFIFNDDDSYEYKTNGDARNDGYMGDPNGCLTDAELAASGNGAAFGSNVHSWAFTDASASPSGRPIIEVTNGDTGAAFIGFYKGYYGGENSDGANPPNGGKETNRYEVMSYVNDGTTETLTISVDISADLDGSAAWSAVLVR